MSSIQSWARHRFGEKAAVAAITVVAAFLRFYRLDQIPPGFQFDQAFYVFDSLRLLQGQFSVFFTAPGESEPLYPYLAMVGVAVFGPNTPLGLKITSAVLGLVTIPVIYIFAREMFRSARIGLLAGAFAAISTWHIFYSRDGERLTLLVLLATLTFLYLWRMLDKRRRRDCILTGLFLGLSLYTYPASRILPIAVTIIVAFAAWQDRVRIRNYLRCFAFVLAVTALVCMPLGVHYILHPDTFISHTAQVSIFASQTDLVYALSDNAVRLFNMFVIQGDGGMIRNVPGRPIFDPVSGALFVLGVFFFFSALILPRAGPANRLRALVVGTWIGLALALSLFSDDAPNFGRILVAFPAVMIIPAWGAGAAWEAIRNPTVRRVGGVALAAMLVGSGVLAYHDYFITFGSSPGALHIL